jgi:uncharacterized membrane protein
MGPTRETLRKHLTELSKNSWNFLKEPPRTSTPPSPVFDRFCIAFLAIDWIAFGSMHFSLHEETRRMLPEWVPFADTVVITTGAAEVTVGTLILFGRTRRIAAIGSLVLLILLIPAVFRILYNDAALPFSQAGSLLNQLLNLLWRLILVPHNVLMAICSIHLLEKPYPDHWPTLEPKRSLLVGPGWAVLLVAVILLLCNAAGFLAVLLGAKGDVATASMWMMMCLAVGGLLGFLFAVPRASTQTQTRDILQPNRNIEVISDWLTKIIVGLGLVHFMQIGEFLNDRSLALSKVLSVNENFVLALIIYFLIAGFLEGYVLTRIFLQSQFVDAIQSKLLPRQRAPREPAPEHAGSVGTAAQ